MDKNSQKIELFLDACVAEKGVSVNTISAYRSDLMQFLEFYKGDVAEVEVEDAIAFSQYLAEKGFEPNSVARKLSAMRDFFKFLLSEKITDENPFAEVDNPKRGRAIPKFLTRDEINDIIFIQPIFVCGLEFFRIKEVTQVAYGVEECLCNGVIRILLLPSVRVL